MIAVVEYEGGHSSSVAGWRKAGTLAIRWRRFLEANRERIRAGKLFKLGEPPLTPQLFPRDFAFSRKDKPAWPDWSKISAASDTDPEDPGTWGPPSMINEGRYGWQQKEGSGRLVWLRRDATNADLQALSHREDIVSLRPSSAPGRLAGPFITDDGLRHIRGWKRLKVLDLSELGITDDGLRHVAELTALETLDLVRTKVTDKGLVHLKRLENLRKLQLYFLPITDAGTVHLKGLTSLKALHFHDARITDSGLENLRDMLDLEVLQLRGALVTDRSMPIIGKMTKLRHLDLTRTKVTDEGLAHLGALSGLTSLRLSGTGVGDQGMSHVGGLGNLEDLALEGTRVTDAGLLTLA